MKNDISEFRKEDSLYRIYLDSFINLATGLFKHSHLFEQDPYSSSYS